MAGRHHHRRQRGGENDPRPGARPRPEVRAGDGRHHPCAPGRRPAGGLRDLTDDAFTALEAGGALLVRAEYRGKQYGITRAHLTDVERRGRAPILPPTPRSLAEFARDTPEAAAFLAVFLDAPDPVLDDRLGLRGEDGRWADVLTQREEDRAHVGACRHVLESTDADRTLAQMLGWWREGPAT